VGDAVGRKKKRIRGSREHQPRIRVALQSLLEFTYPFVAPVP
jgi:hypothetical protein